MLCQVIICSVCDSPQFAPSKWEKEFYICGCFTVEAQFFFVMITITYFIILETKRAQPVKTEFLPVREPFKVCIRFTEEFKFHLLKIHVYGK